MKFKYISFLIVFILIFESETKAQVPGFGGRKVSVFYDQSISAPLFFLTDREPYNAAEKEYSFIREKIRTQINVELELAVSRRMAIGVHYFNFKTGYRRPGSSFLGLTAYSRNITQNGISVFARFYRVSLKGRANDDGAIAPLGFYFTPNLILSFDTYEAISNRNIIDMKPIYSIKSRHLGFNFKVGRHFPLFDKVMLDIGAGFGGFIPNRVDLERRLKTSRDPYFAIAIHHKLTGYIGIGYAIF